MQTDVVHMNIDTVNMIFLYAHIYTMNKTKEISHYNFADQHDDKQMIFNFVELLDNFISLLVLDRGQELLKAIHARGGLLPASIHVFEAGWRK